MSVTPMDSLHQHTLRIAERLRQFFRSVSVRRRQRALRLCETVSLGDKRFVAVVQFERQRFLLGVTPHSVSLLQAVGEEGRSAPGEHSATSPGGAI
jgi:flagellar biogenesis protein FliO